MGFSCGNDIFLLQILAEITYDNNILLFVLLHQSFEQYGKNLNTKLKNEWAKIQGRYEVLSLVETVTQSLHIMGQVFPILSNFASNASGSEPPK
jgi:hypothetical protein